MTEGFSDSWSRTDNTYVGRPRQLSQLANGSIVFNRVHVATANDTAEWVAAQAMIPILLSSVVPSVSLHPP